MTSSAPAVSELAERIRAAQTARRSQRIVGSGTWLESGGPVDAAEELSVKALNNVVEYVPGDLTITVGAGTSLEEIERVTAVNDQWLTLDPFGSRTGTIGATLATASFGPLATGFGTPRDLVLGLEAVTGLGNVIRAGGRVVKNVAGFDLVRLFTGSRGTLGVITEVSLRLRARPSSDVSVAIGIENTTASVRSVSRALRSWPFTPMAAEVLDAAGAAAIGLPQTTTLLLRCGGNARSVAAQRQRAGSLGKAVEVDRAVWNKLRGIETGSSAVLRVTDLPSAFAERWDDVQPLCGRDGIAIGSPARGAVRCILGDVDQSRIGVIKARARSASFVFEKLPTAAAWHSLTSEIEAASIAGRIRSVFDPAGIMNPGTMRMTR